MNFSMNMGPDRVQSGAYDLQSLQQQLQMMALQKQAQLAGMTPNNSAFSPQVAAQGGTGLVVGAGGKPNPVQPLLNNAASQVNVPPGGFINPSDPAYQIQQAQAQASTSQAHLLANNAQRSDYQFASDYPWSAPAAQLYSDTNSNIANINRPKRQDITVTPDPHTTASQSVEDTMNKIDFYRKAPANSEFIKQFPTVNEFLNSGIDANHMSAIQQNKGIPDSFLAQLEDSRHKDIQRSGGSGVDSIKLMSDLEDLKNKTIESGLKNPQAGSTVPWLGPNYRYSNSKAGASLERDAGMKKELNDKASGEIDLTSRAFNLANKIDGDLSQGVPLSSLSARGNELSEMSKELKAKLRDSGLYNSSRLSDQTMKVMDGLADDPVGFVASYKGKEEIAKSYRRLALVNMQANDEQFEKKGINREHYYDTVTNRIYDSLAEVPNPRPDAIIRMNSKDPKGSQAALEKLGVI